MSKQTSPFKDYKAVHRDMEHKASMTKAAPDMYEACRRIAFTNIESMGEKRFSEWAKAIAFNAIQEVKP